MSKLDFLIPVGKSPIPVYRAAITLSQEYNVSLICTKTTKQNGLRIKNQLAKHGISVNLFTCFDEEENIIKDLFGKNKTFFSSKFGTGIKNVYVGPGSKMLTTSMIISFPQNLIRIWVEKNDSSRRGVIPVLRKITRSDKEIKLNLISEEEIFELLNLKKYTESSLLFDGGELSADILRINNKTGKIELSFKPPKFNKNLNPKQVGRRFRDFEKRISESRTKWEKSVHKHVLEFKLERITTHKTHKDRLEKLKRRLDLKWKGGEIICQ